MKNYKLAVIGATGLVGQTVLKILEEKNLPISEYTFFASSKSVGKKITFLNKTYYIKTLCSSSFDLNFDFAIFCANSNVSKQFIPIAIAKGTIVIDNSSYFRMNKNVPLIVPEVNLDKLYNHNQLISNPNCSTIQAAVVLKPLNDCFNIKRIIFNTYQAVSGSGINGVKDLKNGIKYFDCDSCFSSPYRPLYDLHKFPYPIFSNCIPQIDDFLENGYTKEENKMINETKKILGNPNLNITATTVRVPVFNCHSESINIEFEKGFDLDNLKHILKNSPGIVFKDNPFEYPTVLDSNDSDGVYVGRLRRDYSVLSGINLWVVADNLRKGAATNAIQILENLLYKD